MDIENMVFAQKSFLLPAAVDKLLKIIVLLFSFLFWNRYLLIWHCIWYKQFCRSIDWFSEITKSINNFSFQHWMNYVTQNALWPSQQLISPWRSLLVEDHLLVVVVYQLLLVTEILRCDDGADECLLEAIGLTYPVGFGKHFCLIPFISIAILLLLLLLK